MAEQRKHAILSASGSSHWLNCGPSALAAERVEEVDTGYNSEGTLAHDLVELKLQRAALGNVSAVDYAMRYRAIKSNHQYSEEMERVTADHVEHVLEIIDQYDNAVTHVELKVDFSEFAPEGFGTADTVIYSEDDAELTIIDYKHGAGVIVSAKDNPQTRLYALGALNTLDLRYRVDTVRIIISQPRRGNWSAEELSTRQLLYWGYDHVKPRALRAYVADGERTPGKWCRFCGALPYCKAVRDMVRLMGGDMFENEDDLTPDELTAVYKQKDIIRSWLVAVNDRIELKLNRGETVPGLKIVQTKGRRYWTDPEAVTQLLTNELGFSPDAVTNTKLRGIGYIENLVYEDDFIVHLDEFINTSVGKPTITNEDDPRPAIGHESAAIDFSEPIDLD